MPKPRSHGHRVTLLPIALLAGMLFLLASAVISSQADPTDAPSTQPSTAPSAQQLRQLVAQLGSDDPQVRETALFQLMNLSASELPALRDAAIAQGPLLPGQVANLRQAVSQIFLSSQPYDYAADPRQDMGFLGIRWDRPSMIQSPDGVAVSDRIPGFVAYRMLRPGDIIAKIIRQPEAPDLEVHEFAQFQMELVKMHAGDLLRLEVLRYGRRTDVSIRLDHRPTITVNQSQAVVEKWMEDRAKVEEAYWNSEFQAIDPSSQDSVSSQP